MKCSVIISAYDNFPALQKSLWGFEAQSETDMEIIIADDGSDDEFVDQLRAFMATSPLPIKHLWQRDDGFRKCRILNKAILASSADYLIFVDADIVPRQDFVATHLRLARPGRYLSGGSQVNIPASVYPTLTEADIKQQRLFDHDWLAEHGAASSKSRSRLRYSGFPALLLDMLTFRMDAFVGCNASVSRNDAIAINGFDESYVYGGEDRDFGIRLANHGVHGVRHKYSLCYVHLQHDRPYRDDETVKRQKKRFAARRFSKIIQADIGIRELATECPQEVEEMALPSM